MWQVVPVLALSFAVAAVGCDGLVEPNAAFPALPESADDTAVEVVTQAVRRGAISQRVFAPGSLAARRVSMIGAEVPGRIQEVAVDVGQRVEAGALLFQIERAPYEAVLRRAESGLDVARSERLQVAADLERLKSLRGGGVSSQSKLERGATALAVAKALERQAREAVAMAQLDLKRTSVVAPYAGSIAERLADEGTMALAQPQTIVIVIQETTELEARADVAERQLSVVRAGDPALVHVEGLPEPIRATVDAVADTIDPATRTYGVRIRVPNPEHRLKAGVFARVEIQPAGNPDALLIPREAIRSEDAQTRVLVVRDGRAESVSVRIGLVDDSEAEVVSGLTEGEPVIVGHAAQELAPGIRVRVVGVEGAAERAGGALPREDT